MTTKRKSINTAIAPIHRKPAFTSEMVTQGLLWETLTVTDRHDNWYFVSQQSGYKGWIHQSFLCDRTKTDREGHLFCTDRLLPVYSAPISTSDLIDFLSIGTVIPRSVLLERSAPFLQFEYPDGRMGWVKEAHFNHGRQTRKSLVKMALSFLGTPYIWGGVSGYGFDCSGFVQMVFRCKGIEIPRDSANQAIHFPKVSNQDVRQGDLIFFRENKKISHVGICLPMDQFIHCSGSVRITSVNPEDEHYESWAKTKFDGYRSVAEVLH